MKIWIISCLLSAAIVFVSSSNIELSSTPVTLPDPENLINNISCAIFDVYKASVVAVHKYCTDVLEKVSEHIEIEEKEIKRETLAILTDIKTDVDAVFDNFNGVLSKLSQIIDDQASNVGQEVQTIWNELKYGVRRLKRNIRLIRVNMNKSLTEIKENFDAGTEEFKDAMDNLYSKVLKKLCFEVRSATNMFQHALSLPSSNYFDIELEDVYKDWTQFLQMAKETPNILFKSAKSLLNQLYNIVQAKFFLSGVLSDNSLWPVSSLVWEDAVLVKRFVDNSLKRVGRFIKASLAQISAKFGKDNFASQEAIQSLYNQVFKEIEQLIATTEIPFKRIYNFDDKQLPFTIPRTLSSTTYGTFEDLLRYLDQNGHPVKCDIAECQSIVLQIVPSNENAQAENFFDYMLSNAFTKSPQSTVSPLYSIILQEERIQEVTAVYRHLYDLVQKCAETAHEDGYKLPDIISMKMDDDAHKYQRLMNDLRVYMSKCVCFIEKSYKKSGQEYKDIMMDFCTNVKQKLDIAAGYTLKFIRRIDSYLKNHEGCLEKFALNPTISSGEKILQEITHKDETNTKVITDETKHENLETSTSVLVNSGDEIVNAKSENTDVFMEEQPDNIEEVGTISMNKIQKDESISQMNQIDELGQNLINDNLNKASDLMVTHRENIAATDIDLKTTISSSEKNIPVDNIEDLDTSTKLKQNLNSEDLVKNNMMSSAESVTTTMSNTASRSLIVENEHTSSSNSHMSFHENHEADKKISETVIHNEASSEENQPDNIEEKGISSEETHGNHEDTDYETNHIFDTESTNSISMKSHSNSVHSKVLLNERESSRNVDVNNLDNFKSISETVSSLGKDNELEEIISDTDQVTKLSTHFSEDKNRDLSDEKQQKHSAESHSVTEQSESQYYKSSSKTTLEQEIEKTLASESLVETMSKEEKCTESKCESSVKNCKEDTHLEKEWSINTKAEDMKTNNLSHSLPKEILQDISKDDEESIIENKLELDHEIASHTAILDKSSKLEENSSVSKEKEIDSDENLRNKIEQNISHQTSTNEVQMSSIHDTVSVIDDTVSEVLASGEVSTLKTKSSDNKSGSEEDKITLEKLECAAMHSTSEVHVSNHEHEIKQSLDLSDKSSSKECNLSTKIEDLASPLNLKSITTTSNEIVDLVTDDEHHIRECFGSVTPSLQDTSDDELNKITMHKEENHQNSKMSSKTETYSESLNSELLTEDRVSSNSDHEVGDIITSRTNVEGQVDSMTTDKHSFKSSNLIDEVGSDVTTRSLDLSEENHNFVSSFSTHEEKSESKMTEKTLEIDNINLLTKCQTEPVLEKSVEVTSSHTKADSDEQSLSSISSHLNSNAHHSEVEIHSSKNDVVEEIVTDISSDDNSVNHYKGGTRIANEVNEVSEESSTVMSCRSIDIDEHKQEIEDLAVDCEKSHLNTSSHDKVDSNEQSLSSINSHLNANAHHSEMEIHSSKNDVVEEIVTDISSGDNSIKHHKGGTRIANEVNEVSEESSTVMSCRSIDIDEHKQEIEDLAVDCEKSHLNTSSHDKVDSNEQSLSSISSHLNANAHHSEVEIYSSKNNVEEEIVSDISSDDNSIKHHKIGKKIASEVNEVSEETSTVMSCRSIDIDEHKQEIEDLAVDCEKSHLVSSKEQSAEEIQRLEIEDSLKMEQKITSDSMHSSSKDIIIEDGEKSTPEKIMNSASEHFEESSKLETSSLTLNGDKHQSNISSEEREGCKNKHIDLDEELTISGNTNISVESSHSSSCSNSHSDSSCKQNQIIHTEILNQDGSHEHQSHLLTSQEILHKPETYPNLETLKDNIELLSDTSAISTNTRSIDTDEKMCEKLDHKCLDSTTIVDHNIPNCDKVVETQEIELNDIKEALSSTSGETHLKDLIESDEKAKNEAILDRGLSIHESEIENESSNSFTSITSSKLNSVNEDETRITKHTSLDAGSDKDEIACTSAEKITSELSEFGETNLTVAEKMMLEETQHESIAKTDSKVEHHDILLDKDGTSDLIRTQTAKNEETALHNFKSVVESESASAITGGKPNDDASCRENHITDMKKDISDEQIKVIDLSHDDMNELMNSVTSGDIQLKNIKATDLHSLQQDCTSMPDDTTFIDKENLSKLVQKIESSTDSSSSSSTKQVMKVGSNDDETPFYKMLWFPNQKWKTKIPQVSSPSTDEDYGWLGWLVPGMRGIPETGKPMNMPKESIDANESEKLEKSEMTNIEKEESNYSYSSSSSNSETTQSSFSKTETTTNESASEISKMEKSDVSIDSQKQEVNIFENEKNTNSLLTGGITSVQPEEPRFYKKWYNSLIKT